MSKDSSMQDAPELELDHAKIDALIEPEARVKAYHELFTKYLEAIEKEPSINKKRYYGRHLENLMDQISADDLTENAQKSRKELLSQIATFTETLKNPDQGIYINTHAQFAREAGQRHSFKEATAQSVAQQVSEHINDKLIPWAENLEDKQLSLDLTAQEANLWTQGEKGGEANQYQKMGKKFWDKCLSFMEKLFPPKAIKFDVDNEAKKYEAQFKEDKNSYIASALNFIKSSLSPGASKELLESQIGKNIESLNPRDRSSDMIKSFQQHTTATTAALPFNKPPSQLSK